MRRVCHAAARQPAFEKYLCFLSPMSCNSTSRRQESTAALSPSLAPVPTAANPRTATLIPGDGIGPEISAAVRTIFEAANVPVIWEPVDVAPVRKPDGSFSIPDKAIESMLKVKNLE